MTLRKRFSSSTTRTETLRAIVARISYTKNLDDFPDRFADLLDIYDRAPLDSVFREDLHSLFNGTLAIASAMVDPSFDANQATEAIARQIRLLTRILTYLSSRPTRTGFSILSTRSGALLGAFSTEQEASQHLSTLSSLGHASNAMVVPVKITSQFCLRPDRQPLTGPLPSGILPAQPPAGELSGAILPEPATELIKNDPSGNSSSTPNPGPTTGSSST